jgi:hypothetical protein
MLAPFQNRSTYLSGFQMVCLQFCFFQSKTGQFVRFSNGLAAILFFTIRKPDESSGFEWSAILFYTTKLDCVINKTVIKIFFNKTV